MTISNERRGVAEPGAEKNAEDQGLLSDRGAATTLIFLAIRNVAKGGRAVRERGTARNQLAIMFAGRFDA